jgi:hypothetical protein
MSFAFADILSSGIVASATTLHDSAWIRARTSRFAVHSAEAYKFLLLTPSSSYSAIRLTTKADEPLYGRYLASAQKLRGRTYLNDGAIQPDELDDNGRFRMPGDEQGWHFLLVDGYCDVIGCVRYLVHLNTVRFCELRLSHSPLAHDRLGAAKLQKAVEADLNLAKKEDLLYVEIGGWALADEYRGTRAALEILLGSYTLAHFWGGCLASCTATVRHNSC